ncbi:MAG TPA: cupin domain-containing protein [Candidatus Baltobacteraceae bacterium]|nr:cupin domain-containing protein [Candidatus Baltobacteraceae bacterium]
MLARLDIPGAWMWSAWQPERGMNFNSYLFERDGGCVAVDPLALDEASMDALERMGGVHTIVITNPDHVRASAALRERFGSRIIDSFQDGQEVFAGAYAIKIPHGKTDEAALHLRREEAAVIGDAIIGAPAGSLSLLPDEKLADPRRLAFALRRLWALCLRTLLLCDGQPIFGGADAAIGKLLESRLGAELFRINTGDLTFTREAEPEPYVVDDAEIGLLIGARKLGYRLAGIPPGKAFCPLHWHVQSEEFFYVIQGQPSIRMLEGTLQCRPGDFIAFPTGERGAHQLRNDSSESCLVLLVGMEEEALGLEACFYPDSDKLLLATRDGRLRTVRASPDLNYYDGE